MEDEEHDAEAGSKFRKCSQQSYRVSAAADGEADALAGSDEAMVAQVLFEAVKHRNIIAEALAVTGRSSLTTGDRKFFSDLRQLSTGDSGRYGCCSTNTKTK